jgi:hypothetical protein
MIGGVSFIKDLLFLHLLGSCYLVVMFSQFILISTFFRKIILHFALPFFLLGMQLSADVASNWLACFPYSAQKYVYDVFFVHGLVTEVLQILVSYLQHNGSDDIDVNVVISNSERYMA